MSQLKRMSKWLWGLGLAGISALAYAWARWPKVREPEEVANRLSKARKRWAATQQQALDPKTNGYVSETFQPFWDVTRRERDNPSEVEEIITRWGKLSEDINDTSVFDERKSELSEALARFRTLAPALAERMTRPLFVVPASELTLTTPIISVFAQKYCIQATIGLSQALMVNGRPSESVEALLSLIGYAKAQFDRGNLISEIIASSALRRAVEGVCQVLTPATLLPTEDWQRLSLGLSQAVPPEDWLERCLEMEMAAACGSFALAHDGRYRITAKAPLHLIPGMVERERRIYLNIMTDFLARLRLGHAASTEVLPKWVAWATGRTGWSGPLGFMPGERLRQSFWVVQRCVLGMAILTSILAFRAEFGSLPSSLSDFSRAGFSLPPLDFARLSYLVSDQRARLVLPYPIATTWDPEPPEINLGRWGNHIGGTVVLEIPISPG